jgi:hypothetical protein
VKVVVDVWLETAVCLEDFVNRVCVLGCVLCGSGGLARDDEGHNILGFDVFALGLKAESDLHRRHGVAIWVLIGVFAELCVNSVFASRNGVFTHLLRQLTEVVMNLLYDDLGIFAAQQEVEKLAT